MMGLRSPTLIPVSFGTTRVPGATIRANDAQTIIGIDYAAGSDRTARQTVCGSCRSWIASLPCAHCGDTRP